MLGFLIFILVESSLPPMTLKPSPTTYQATSEYDLAEHPTMFEGKKITCWVTIESTSVPNSNTSQIVHTKYLTLQITLVNQTLSPDTTLIIRGTSHLSSKGYVSVEEWHRSNYNSEIISIPGILLFVISFFLVFRIDISQWAFISRRKDDA